MTQTNHKNAIWLVSVSFLLFQFFLQLSSGVIMGALMKEMQLSAFAMGVLASSFYYVYTTMQLPVGILFDKYSPRNLLTINAFFCASGCFVFANGEQYLSLLAGRILMGAGSSFAFIGLAHLLRIHFPLKRFSFMMGLSETVGFTATVICMISMSMLVNQWGWRSFIQGAGFLGLFISWLCWLVIPNTPANHKKTELKQQKKYVFSMLLNKTVWINGLFVGLGFTIVTVFGALWAIPFVQLKLHCPLYQASIISALLLFGAGISCPLFGKLSIELPKRKPLMHASCLSSALLLIMILYLPIKSPVVLGFLMLSAGICCGAYLLSYTIANELAPVEARSTYIGFTNTLAMLTAPLLQPIIGLLLDRAEGNPDTLLSYYQSTLLLIPFALLVASFLILFLPEKTKDLKFKHNLVLLKTPMGR